MSRFGVRVLLALAGLVALVAAGALLWSSEARIRTSESSLRLASDASRRALVDASDLRAAQQAYVAVGQGEDFWFARVAALSKDLDDVLTVFKGHLASPEALAAADAAAGALQDFAQVDKRAREFAQAHKLSQASDVVFAEGFEVTQKLTASVVEAITAETVAHHAAGALTRRREAIALFAGGGIAALALLLLIAGTPPPAPAVVLPQPVAPLVKTRSQDPADLPIVTDRPAPSPARPAPAPPALDLGGVAALCSDLARVTDTRAVPALLERTVALLDAAGIVLWVADPDGRELSPVLVHGYSPQMTARLGTIPREAANVTASAFRTGLLQTVKGDAVSNGAIAAPLVAPTGCLGVVALEMKNGGEQREPLLAAARIIASQLATLIGPPSARPRAEAAG